MNEPQGDSPTPHQAVAAEVRAQLARRRMSGRRAAFALGWKQPYIARRLSGEIPFDVNDLAALAQLLELPVSEFFGVRGVPGTTGQGFTKGALSTRPALRLVAA
jgi:transcriptional regulator with XRE-family HTH domain